VTAVEHRPAPPAAPPPRWPNRVWALLRNSWRQLTSMRTALVLLFLLALAAIPGSVLPQRSVNPENVATYFGRHPKLAPVLDRLGGFDVYASVWFAAIYLLLFTSLVGCVVPRLVDHLRALRAVPPDAPHRLNRLPQHAYAEPRPGDPTVAAAAAAVVLRRRRYRTAVREQADGGWTVAAEKGYLKETGNLLFHFALLAVLVGVGFGHWYGWHGNRLLVAGADRGFCNTVPQYDESSFGPWVDPGNLPDFCLRLTDFTASYEPNGIPKRFLATVDVTENDGPAQRRTFTVNDPLRLHHAAVHLLGHGYAPILRYTDRYGQQQTKVVPFLPTDTMLTSEGVAQFPDVNIDPKTNARDRKLQVGFEGVYLPTVRSDGSPASAFPAQRDPALFLTAYRGDLGVDVGIPGSVYALDRAQIASGELKQVSGERPHKLRPGESWTLDDGTRLEFLGTEQFVTLSIRHDPTQPLVLAGAVLGLIGLMLSLAGHRRRVWFRAASLYGRTVLEAGGLPRTDYAGFGDEFNDLFSGLVRAADEALGEDGTP
jgi:cytochrome c biogenesis protein